MIPAPPVWQLSFEHVSWMEAVKANPFRAATRPLRLSNNEEWFGSRDTGVACRRKEPRYYPPRFPIARVYSSIAAIASPPTAGAPNRPGAGVLPPQRPE